MRTIIFLAVVLAVIGAATYFFITERPFDEMPNPTPSANTSQTPPPAASGNSFIVNLRAENNSGESGVATFTEIGATKVRVGLDMRGVPAGANQPAHVHVGSCPTPGAVKYPLANVVDGKSVTELDVAYDDIIAGLPLAVNVHKSAAEANVYVACGNVGLDPLFPKG